MDELPFDVEEELASEPERVVAVPGAAAAVGCICLSSARTVIPSELELMVETRTLI